MTLPWLPFPRAFAMDPRLRLVSMSARGLFLDVICASDDRGSVWVPEGHDWIAVCAALSGGALAKVEEHAAELRRVGLVEVTDREIHVAEVVRWQEDLRRPSAHSTVAEDATPPARRPHQDPHNTLRAHFSNRQLRSAEARRAWLCTPQGIATIDRLGMDLTTASAIADRAGQPTGRFGAGNDARKNGSKGHTETSTSFGSNGSKLAEPNGSKLGFSPTPSLPRSDQKDHGKRADRAPDRQQESAARIDGKDAEWNGSKLAAANEPLRLTAAGAESPPVVPPSRVHPALSAKEHPNPRKIPKAQVAIIDSLPIPGTPARAVYEALIADPVLRPIVVNPGDFAVRVADPDAYPGVSVLAEIKRAGEYAASHPERRYSDGRAFLRHWLTREADEIARAPRPAQPAQSPSAKVPHLTIGHADPPPPSPEEHARRVAQTEKLRIEMRANKHHQLPMAMEVNSHGR